MTESLPAKSSPSTPVRIERDQDGWICDIVGHASVSSVLLTARVSYRVLVVVPDCDARKEYVRQIVSLGVLHEIECRACEPESFVFVDGECVDEAGMIWVVSPDFAAKSSRPRQVDIAYIIAPDEIGDAIDAILDGVIVDRTAVFG